MVSVSTFWYMVLCILGSILLVILIILGVKLINTVNRVNNLLDNVETSVDKVNNVFKIVDTITDNFAFLSDRIVEGIAGCIRKIFIKNNRKDDENEGEEK